MKEGTVILWYRNFKNKFRYRFAPNIVRLILFLAVVCFLGFANGLKNDFLLDDYIEIFGEKGVNNKTLVDLFRSPQGNFYRPVGHLPLFLAYRLFQDRPILYHLFNLTAFILICFLFFRLVIKLSADRDLSLIAVLLYALHPINGMLVNYISASIILMYLVNMQLCLLSFLKYLDSGKKWFLIGSMLFFGAALLSHEMGLMIPLFLVTLLYFLRRDKFKKEWKKTIWFWAIAGIYVLVRINFFNFNRTVWGAMQAWQDPGAYAASLMNLLSWYGSKLVFPKDVLLIWTDVMAQQSIFFKTLALAVGVFFCLLLIIRWGKGIKPMALSFWVLGFLPLGLTAFTYYPFTGPIIEPHWFYFSSIGFFILLAKGLLGLKRIFQRILWGALMGILFVVLLTLSWQNNSHFRNQEAYCRFWLDTNRRNLTPYYGLGKVYFDRADYQKAAYYFQEGINRTNYNNIYILTELGFSYYMLGEKTTAQRFFQAAFKEDFNYSLTCHYLGVIFLKEKSPQVARSFFRKALELYPRLFAFPENLERARYIQGLDPEVKNIYAQLSRKKDSL